MKTAEIRQAFLEFFQSRDHMLFPSSSLIPANDPTLLFTNAGMVQFKNVFLGEQQGYKRATSAQRCVRAGGKHNDLENVGYTARHHTFFEMLGNFSFGDYFKQSAIEFAWQFLTEILKLSPEKLWITVFEEDKEAADIWLKKIGINPNKLSYCGEKDNFWAMGDTGPCGPCSEIFYDHGPAIAGGPPGSATADGDRYVEIWNLVFMQFNRSSDGVLNPLPAPSVDTGMGLERIAAVLQGVHSNYEIDLFVYLLTAIAALVDDTLAKANPNSLRVIADHIRSTAFLITDGVVPSNEGRGYVLRRIIRRALRHGYQLGLNEPFFYRLLTPLIEQMGNTYPELIKSKATTEKIIYLEEMQFAQTLSQGMKLLEQNLNSLKGNILPGAVTFLLYDTYGFPPDLTADIVRERGLSLDEAGFKQAMEKQRQQSQASSQFTRDQDLDVHLLSLSGITEFIGYERCYDKAQIVHLLNDTNQLVTELTAPNQGIVVLDRTPFYAESGGQVGDTGELLFKTGIFIVQNTQKKGNVYLHYGKLETGTLSPKMSVTAKVSVAREAIMLNHSATHLLHAALRHILGEHVIQKGSLVEPDRLRFDFSHFEALTLIQIKTIESLVNQKIRANLPCSIELMSAKSAKEKGAMALFEEKYGDTVRVLSMGDFSIELCGGTHVKNTGQIGLFKIISETGIAAGIRRIEAVTGEKALEWVDQQQSTLLQVVNLLKISAISDVATKVQQLLSHIKTQEKSLIHLKQEILQKQLDKLLATATFIQDVTVLTKQIPDVSNENLRYLVDECKKKWDKVVVLLVTVLAGKIHIVAGISTNSINTTRLKANELVSFVAHKLGGKGGGKAELAQGAGQAIDKIDVALESVYQWVERQMKQVK